MICYIIGILKYINFIFFMVNEKILYIEIKFVEDIKVMIKFDVL